MNETDSLPPLTCRETGRVRACEAVLYAEFGRPSEAAVNRIVQAVRQDVMSRTRTARRRLLYAGWAAAAATVLAAVGVWRVTQTHRGDGKRVRLAKVEEVSIADCGLRIAESVRRDLKVGDEVREGDWVETGPPSPDGLHRGRVKLRWIDGSTALELESNVECGLRNAEWVELRRGRLTAEVSPESALRTPHSAFVVETPHARATVLGTRFSLTVRGPDHSALGTPHSAIGSTRLQVEDGLVRFTRLADEESIDVGPGHHAMAGEDVALEAVSVVVDRGGAVVWRDAFDDIAAWQITKWREPGHITMDLAPQGFDERPGALRLTYDFPKLPGTGARQDHWVLNHRTVDRPVDVPGGATHIRFRFRVVRADPGAVLTLWMMPEGRSSGWCWSDRGIADRGRGWQLVEQDLSRIDEYWDSDRGTLRGRDVPPFASGDIRWIEFGLNLGSVEVWIDDIAFVRKQ